MARDKKAEGASVSFVLPEAIGSVRLVPLDPAAAAALIHTENE